MSYAHAGQNVRVLVEHTGVMFVDMHGELLAEHSWPSTGTRYVSNHTGERTGKPRGRPRKRSELSPMS